MSQAQCQAHASGQGEDEASLGQLQSRQPRSMQRQAVCQLVHEAAARCLGLHRRHVAGAANAMSQPEVPPSDKGANDTPFTFPDTNAARRIVGVHVREFLQNLTDQALVPALGRETPVGKQFPQFPGPPSKRCSALYDVRCRHQSLC